MNYLTRYAGAREYLVILGLEIYIDLAINIVFYKVLSYEINFLSYHAYSAVYTHTHTHTHTYIYIYKYIHISLATE